MKRPKSKFKVGQVVFLEAVEGYFKISSKDYNVDYGVWGYSLSWDGDLDYEYQDEKELRCLTSTEAGKQ